RSTGSATLITLLAAAAAAGLLIAPVSYHRMVFQRDRKGALVINLVTGSLAAAAVAGFCDYLWCVLPVRNDRPQEALLPGGAVDALSQQIQMATMPPGLLDHVSQGLAEGERHPGCPGDVVQLGRRGDLPRPRALGLVRADQTGQRVAGVEGEPGVRVAVVP